MKRTLYNGDCCRLWNVQYIQCYTDLSTTEKVILHYWKTLVYRIPKTLEKLCAPLCVIWNSRNSILILNKLKKIATILEWNFEKIMWKFINDVIIVSAEPIIINTKLLTNLVALILLILFDYFLWERLYYHHVKVF